MQKSRPRLVRNRSSRPCAKPPRRSDKSRDMSCSHTCGAYWGKARQCQWTGSPQPWDGPWNRCARPYARIRLNGTMKAGWLGSDDAPADFAQVHL